MTFLDTAKGVATFVAGVAAAKVTSSVIEEFTTKKAGVYIPIDDPDKCRIGIVALEHNRVEKIVLAVGAFTISSVVGAVVSKSVRKELDDLEDIIRDLSDETKTILEEARRGKGYR